MVRGLRISHGPMPSHEGQPAGSRAEPDGSLGVRRPRRPIAYPGPMSDLFAPAGLAWTPVSARLAVVLRLTRAVPLAVLGLVAALAGAVIARWSPTAAGLLLIAAAALLAGALTTWAWAARHQRSWGYAEREDDLVITHGIWFRRAVAVPYGRMQFVDVQAGPIDQLFGLATVTLHTASTRTAATIPGLERAEAARLRHRLTELGEAHGAGI